MSEQENTPAWSEDSEAVLVAVVSQLGELPNYDYKMNVIVNALRSVMTQEALDQLKAVTGSQFVELQHLIIGLELLVKEFIDQFESMPKRVRDVIHSETGCGTCATCVKAKRDAWADGKAIRLLQKDDEAKAAIERLIATMTGGKGIN